MADLLMHCGGKHITRDELNWAPTPARTDTWVPVPHHRMLSIVDRTIEAQGFRVTNEAHGLWGDGARYFGLMELGYEAVEEDFSLVLGLRNSHDKSFPASLALGSQVLVCDNLSFFGEVVLKRRHTRFIERDLPGVVNEAFGRLSDLRMQQADRIGAYKEKRISDRTVHDLLVKAVDSRVIPVTQLPKVLDEWREPSHQAFTENGRTVWRLFNAFTESFKGRSLEMLPRRSHTLHGLMDRVCHLAA
ncbi:DUF945 domain-containing protein [bacterium]|nr:DUF945 domain-containing protein [bacterium]